MSDSPRICDYEGSAYRTEFWEGRGRTYEDSVERAVLRRLLPTQGKRFLEIGAGFGRLSQEYRGYQKIVLLDYSFSQLQYARQHLGDERFIYVAANAYQLPFKAGVFDGASMIRVLHHFENVTAVLREIRHTLAPQATFILEFANKRNLKAMLRYALKHQTWDPYDLSPVEFVALNFDFHPRYIRQALSENGFATQQQIPVSFFRLGWLKRVAPVGWLVNLDALMQRTGWLISPSIFTRNLISSVSATPDQTALPDSQIFVCPLTKSDLQRQGNLLYNAAGQAWQIRDGIYDFKAPL